MRVEAHAHPDKHAATRPVEIVHLCFGDHGPVALRGFQWCPLLELEAPVLEDVAHARHAALIRATQPFDPAHPAVDFPSSESLLLCLVLPRELHFCRLIADKKLGDHGLHESGRLGRRCFRDAEDALNDCWLGSDPA